MTTEQAWLRTIAWLRREFPPQYKTIVRTTKTTKNDFHGLIELKGRTYHISIRKQGIYLKLDTLLHEWAHAMTWKGNDTDEHGDEWALMYGRIYRNWLTWNYGKDPHE